MKHCRYNKFVFYGIIALLLSGCFHEWPELYPEAKISSGVLSSSVAIVAPGEYANLATVRNGGSLSVDLNAPPSELNILGESSYSVTSDGVYWFILSVDASASGNQYFITVNDKSVTIIVDSAP